MIGKWQQTLNATRKLARLIALIILVFSLAHVSFSPDHDD